MLNVQRTLGRATTAEVGYAGSLHRHLQYLTNLNQGILDASLPVVQRLPYPEWGASGIQWVNADGMGSYHGLAAKFTQRFGTNLNTLLSYTWSKALDTTSNIRGTVGSDFSPQDARCPTSCEKGPSDFNVPQRFVASILCALPFGKGQKFLNHGGVVNQVVGGWQVEHHHHAAKRRRGQYVLMGFRGHQFHYERHPAQLRCRRGPGYAQSQPERLV